MTFIRKLVSFKLIRFLIAIQARSTSERLPNKINEKIGEKTILQHVLSSAKSAQKYLNSQTDKIEARVALLIPEGDQPARDNIQDKGVDLIEGSEHDVLSRYFKALKAFPSDYVIRITGDCPLLPDYIISKFALLARKQNYDYLSNCFEDSRTAFDGMDCEVISARVLYWLEAQVSEALDREHVTTYFRRSPPEWAKIGAIVGFWNNSDLKLSVDTEEDLERVRLHYGYVRQVEQQIEDRYKGKVYVHRV